MNEELSGSERYNLRGIKKQLFPEHEVETQGSQAVLVYLRMRPKRPSEIVREDPDCLHQTSEHDVVALPPKNSKTFKNARAEASHRFSFSKIFNPDTTQKELFDETLRPLLRDFFDGQNCLVFTYGVTNSGRSKQNFLFGFLLSHLLRQVLHSHWHSCSARLAAKGFGCHFQFS